MNQIAPHQSRTVAVRSDAPAFTPAAPKLSAYIDLARHGSNIRPVPADVEQAAWAHVRATDGLFAPANRDDMAAWLGKLAPQVKGAPTHPGDIQAVYAGIWEQCADLPRCVWCVETRRSWGRLSGKGRFWPAAGELYEHLAAYAAQIRNERSGCEKILAIAAPVKPDAPEPRKDPAERSAVRDLLAAWRTERSEQKRGEAVEGQQVRRSATSGARVSDEALLALHEKEAAQGNAASALRAKFLRQKLGIAEQVASHV